MTGQPLLAASGQIPVTAHRQALAGAEPRKGTRSWNAYGGSQAGR